MKKLHGYFGMALVMAMMSETNFAQENEPRKFERNPKKDIEPKPQKGQFHYWFRADGTFLNERQSERMRKDECVFVCFAINDKNAIKKFNKFSFEKDQK